MVERLALSRADIALHYTSNGREQLRVSPAIDAAGERQRLAAVLGEDFAAGVMEIDVAAGPLRLSGWISQPTFSRAQADLTHWFVNGRAVRDRLLINAVKIGYRDVLYGGRHPAYVLHLTIDPREVDVNAHPASRNCASVNRVACMISSSAPSSGGLRIRDRARRPVRRYASVAGWYAQQRVRLPGT